MRKIRKSSLKRRELRSSPFRLHCITARQVNFAELFRSVCRNVSGKLLSHAFAALTALCGVPPHDLLAGCIVLQNSHEFCNTLDLLLKYNLIHSHRLLCSEIAQYLQLNSAHGEYISTILCLMRIPKWDCIPPLETPCSLGSCIQRELLGDF